MIKRICDRCKKEYNEPHPWQNCVLPQYQITKTIGFPICTLKVDLCDTCLEEFEKWLNQKDNNI